MSETEEATAGVAGNSVELQERRHCEEAQADEAIGSSGSPRHFAARDDVLSCVSPRLNRPGAAGISIDGRRIGLGEPPFIVAELSGNHNGDLGRALALIDAAHAAGADAVKLQTYTADTLTIDCDGPHFRIERGPWAGQRLYDLYAWAHTPWDWHEALFDRARSLGLSIFSTPFDSTSVDFLEQFDPPAYKIASFEAVDLPLIESVAVTGRPLIVSTGLASHREIDEAIAAAAWGEGSRRTP